MGKWKTLDGEGFNGFVTYFTKKYGTYRIYNFFTAEGNYDPNGWGPASTVLNYSTTNKCKDQFVTMGDAETAFLQINFKFSPIYLTSYTIRTRTCPDQEAMPESWIVQGSYDNKTWFDMDEVSNSDKLLTLEAFDTFHCKNPALVKHVRIKLTEANWHSQYRFHISRVDFFGEMYGFCFPSCLNINNHLSITPFLFIMFSK